MTMHTIAAQGKAAQAKTVSINVRHIVLDMGLLLMKAALAGVLFGLMLSAAVVFLS